MALPSGFQFNTSKPPTSKQVRFGKAASNQRSPEFDTAQYILSPDNDFNRPYFGVPNGIAFIFPLGAEGFEVRDMATLGRHKYIGEIEIDIDVVHRRETEITLSGVFPGWTGVDNMLAFRKVFDAESPQPGKILNLPGVFPNLQYVVCADATFTHADDERSQDIAYTCTFVQVSVGTTAPITKDAKPSPTGRRTYFTSASVNTLRKISQAVYGNTKYWGDLVAIKANANYLKARNIPSQKWPDYRFPIGTEILY